MTRNHFYSVFLALFTALTSSVSADIIMDRDLRDDIISKGKVISSTWEKTVDGSPYYIQFTMYQGVIYECRMLTASSRGKISVACYDEK